MADMDENPYASPRPPSSPRRRGRKAVIHRWLLILLLLLACAAAVWIGWRLYREKMDQPLEWKPIYYLR
jgi:hypothetical protein